jgi:streptogramin lyase
MALALAETASVATAAVGDIIEFNSGLHPESSPQGIAPGPDGQLWFGNSINAHPNAVGRITATGSITEIYAPGEYIWTESLVRGLDGNLWVVDGTKAIYRLTPDGEWSKFDEGPREEFRPNEITRGAEGNFWFTVVGGEPRAIGRMTPEGQITEYRAGLNPGDFPQEITAGPDGNVWFTDTGSTPAIGRVTPNGEITEFSEGLGSGSVVLGIAAGPDDDLWFTNPGTSSIGRITPTGEVTEFGITLPFTTYPQDIAVGPDGNLWFTAPSVWTTSYIGRITTAGAITLFPMALNAGGTPYPHRISPGADGNMWFTDFGQTPAIGRIETGAPQAVKTAPTMTGVGEVGSTLRCEGESWEAWVGEVPVVPAPGESPAPVQWTRDDRPIPDATQRTYTLGSDDRGHSIGCTTAVVYPLLDVVATATSDAVTLPPPPPTPEEPGSPPDQSTPEEPQKRPVGASLSGATLIACLDEGRFRYLAHPSRCQFFSSTNGSRGARDITVRGIRWTRWGADRATAQARNGTGKSLRIVAFHRVRCGGAASYYGFVRLMRSGRRTERLKLAAPGCGG